MKRFSGRGFFAAIGFTGALLVLQAQVVQAQAVPGDLDPSFGADGRVTTEFGPGSNRAFAMAIQTDGKIVAAGAGGANHFALARYNDDGSLDLEFGVSGKVTTSFGTQDETFGVAIQPDGKIVAAGSTSPAGLCCQFALARYNADGSLDPSFNGDGKVMTSFGGASGASAVVIQPDGKIVAAGGTTSPFFANFALARYNADGSLDPTFGTEGKVTTDFGGGFSAPAGASGVTIQADGRIVAAGVGGPLHDFALARYNDDGSLDPEFGTGGKVTTDFGGFDAANAVVIQADGKIVAAGAGKERFALARYNADGSLDPSFGTDGKVTIQFSGDNIESAAGLAIQHNGKIVAAGSVFINFSRNFGLARFNDDGSLDPSFGTDGKVTTSFGDGSNAGAEAVAIQDDGKIVAAGGAGPCIPPCQFALARYFGD